ncbi:MAG: LLM class flavin-dependent oxidoreductase [Acidimicrobiales bacterium]
MKVRFAVSAGLAPPDPRHAAALVTGAEERGFDSLWFPDLPAMASTDPFLAVAFAAAASGHLKLGVDLVPFGRQPYVFARDVAQLDRLCDGRLLVTLVPGLDAPGERAALGIAGRHRGRLLDALIPDLRRWWAGDRVGVAGHDEPMRLPVLPCQNPLEIWLGGSGPEALRRVGRLADGWLGSQQTSAEAGALRKRILEEADAVERAIDPEHFGLSIAYARAPDDLQRATSLRRPQADITQVVPVGHAGLRSFVGELMEQGLSKFVVRPVAGVTSWDDELDWLAEAVLDLQS